MEALVEHLQTSLDFSDCGIQIKHRYVDAFQQRVERLQKQHPATSVKFTVQCTAEIFVKMRQISPATTHTCVFFSFCANFTSVSSSIVNACDDDDDDDDDNDNEDNHDE